MKTCDCGCIEIGEKDNHPPEYVCKCALCSGHDTGWVHHECMTAQETTPMDETAKELVRELVALLKKDIQLQCRCKDCVQQRKLIEKLLQESD